MWPDPIKNLFTQLAGRREMSLQDSLQGTQPVSFLQGNERSPFDNARQSMMNTPSNQPASPTSLVSQPLAYAWGGGHSWKPSFDPSSPPEDQRQAHIGAMGANVFAQNKYSAETVPIVNQFFSVFDLLAKTGKQKPETMESVLNQLGELEAQVPETGQMFMRLLDSDTFKGHPFHIYLRSRPTDQSASRKKK